ncbi:MAG: hypothetical protein JXR48_18205 [Candidatus Delongbacteria bacterium]|nr:hypothetical protein [Candidatus Delongbacteria bacterium]MBN2836894.1 hypothetical protein [Candidatus Delongbacteria bacterium]
MKKSLMRVLFLGFMIISIIACGDDNKSSTEPDGNKLPVCTINSPGAGAEFIIGTLVNVEVTASDEDGYVALVEIYVDNDLVNVFAEEPYSAVISTDLLQAGNRTIKAIAYDDEGDSKASTVTIKLVEGNLPPTCEIVSPLDNSTFQIGDMIEIEVNAISGDGNIFKVEFYFNENLIYTEYDTPYAYNYDTSNLSEGSYSIKAIVYDDNSETGEDQITINLVEPIPANFDIDWQRVEPNPDASWRSTAISGNGQFIYAASYGTQHGKLYISGDKGEQWIELMPAGDTSQKWNALAVCYTGQNLIIGGAPGRLYHSTNYGQDWVELQLLGNENQHWKSASISDDGSVIVVTTVGKVFVSKNGGIDWNITLQNEFDSYTSSAVSADGQTIYVTRYDNRIFKSINSGDNWSELTQGGSSEWRSIRTSTTGEIVLACSSTKVIFSKNGGSTWSTISPSTESDFYCASMSDDGKLIVAVDYNGKVRFSGNEGLSWEISNLLDGDGFWTNPTISRDKSFCLIPESFYRLFLGEISWQ